MKDSALVIEIVYKILLTVAFCRDKIHEQGNKVQFEKKTMAAFGANFKCEGKIFEISHENERQVWISPSNSEFKNLLTILEIGIDRNELLGKNNNFELSLIQLLEFNWDIANYKNCFRLGAIDRSIMTTFMFLIVNSLLECNRNNFADNFDDKNGQVLIAKRAELLVDELSEFANKKDDKSLEAQLLFLQLLFKLEIDKNSKLGLKIMPNQFSNILNAKINNSICKMVESLPFRTVDLLNKYCILDV